jgi:hypothetical protein
MIYLTPGITQSVWMSLRESAPVGSTSSFKFTLTNDMSGQQVQFYPVDLQPDNKWSRFAFYVGTPQNLPSVLDLRPGMWSFIVEDGSTTLETGKVLVNEQKTWTTYDRPAKNVVVLKR